MRELVIIEKKGKCRGVFTINKEIDTKDVIFESLAFPDGWGWRLPLKDAKKLRNWLSSYIASK